MNVSEVVNSWYRYPPSSTTVPPVAAVTDPPLSLCGHLYVMVDGSFITRCGPRERIESLYLRQRIAPGNRRVQDASLHSDRITGCSPHVITVQLDRDGEGLGAGVIGHGDSAVSAGEPVHRTGEDRNRLVVVVAQFDEPFRNR